MYLFFSICLCFIDADAQTLTSCLLRLLGLQVFLLLVKLAARGTCVLGLQIKGFVLLTFVEFPEVPFLVDDCEDTGTDLPTTQTLESLEAPPPVTSGTCSWDSSTFSSSSWRGSFSFLLLRMSGALILTISAKSAAAEGKQRRERANSFFTKVQRHDTGERIVFSTNFPKIIQCLYAQKKLIHALDGKQMRTQRIITLCKKLGKQ